MTQKTVAIYGGGIAGLSVAHELSRRGWRVRIFESNAEIGGFFRSTRRAADDHMPSEYSWHGMGPWYHNVFDLMKQIPFDSLGSVYERALSRPIDFGVAPNEGEAQFDDSDGVTVDVCKMFRMSPRDRRRWVWLMLKTWTANRRSEQYYARLNAAALFKKKLSPVAWSTWVACFGPWIGSDWTRVSLHTTGLFFRRQLITRPTHKHPADAEGPPWMQGARSGWLLMRGPSSEFWFDRWLVDLQDHGVEVEVEQSLQRLDFDGSRITSGVLASGERVEADMHVLATHPFAAAEILERTPELARLDQLRFLRPLTQDGPHTQVSFRIAFGERILWPRPRCGLVIADSEYNLTLFAEEQVWARNVNLGEDVRALWTGTSCVSSVPGALTGVAVERCTEEQFVEEVKAQLLRCGALDALIREANQGRSLRSYQIIKFEIWHEWKFSPDGIRPRQPKWVTTTHTQPWLPTQATPVPNLVLAGAHTRTAADVWSIEGAVESGRRAAQVIEPEVVVLPQYLPKVLWVLGRIDDLFYAIRAPHFFISLPVLLLLILAIIVWALR